ncbi:MAG TPA: hypothetical protein VLW85_15890, partial [Myxococcales bacterium]|nr:hypothetical protein [Myxococcales bacterium]
MSIDSISGTTLAQAIQGSMSASGATAPAPQDGAQLSPLAQAFSELRQLQSSDPEKFKQVTAAIADKLKEAASQASGPQAQALSKMADQFAQASQTGQLPQPSQQGSAAGHHHHHHHAAAQAYGSQQPQPPQVDLAQI